MALKFLDFLFLFFCESLVLVCLLLSPLLLAQVDLLFCAKLHLIEVLRELDEGELLHYVLLRS